MWHGKSIAVHRKEIAIPRSMFLCSTIATLLKKKETKKSNIRPKRRPPGSLFTSLSFKKLPTYNLYT